MFLLKVSFSYEDNKSKVNDGMFHNFIIFLILYNKILMCQTFLGGLTAADGLCHTQHIAHKFYDVFICIFYFWGVLLEVGRVYHYT